MLARFCLVGSLLLTLPGGILRLTQATAAEPQPGLRLMVAGPEEVVFDDRQSHCAIRQFPDSPARAVREANGGLVLFATFETNWFLTGPDWKSLAAPCRSSGHAAQNPDPRMLDDKYWIQALHSTNGVDFIALGSHEYLGVRHPGRCNHRTSGTMAPPCWYSSITQYVANGNAQHFAPAKVAPVVATPQVPFDPGSIKRVGYFTASNIVSDREYRYVLIFAEGSQAQERGNCLFRSQLAPGPTRWLGWDGTDFTVDLSNVPQPGTDAAARCRPVAGLPQEARGLVRHAPTGAWIAVYSGRIGQNTGVVYSVSDSLTQWRQETMLLDAPLTRRDPECAPVYRYPSIIDHGAPGFAFESVGAAAYLYGIKILLEGCRPVARQITRIPLRIEGGAKH